MPNDPSASPIAKGEVAPADADAGEPERVEATSTPERKIVFTITSDPAARYSTRPQKRQQHDSADLIGVLQIDKRLLPDSRLDQAASEILGLVENEPSLSSSAIVHVLWWHGLPEAQYNEQLVGGVIGLGFEDLIEQWFDRQAAIGANRYGIAAKEVSGQRLAVLLALKNELDLDPVPRILEKQGVLRLSGRVHAPNKSVTVYATSPAGSIVEPEVRRKNRRFDSVVEMNEPGIWQIELIGDGPRGPQALANFPVAVASEHPRRITVYHTAIESDDVRFLENLLYEYLNNARAAAGAPRIDWSDELAAVARAYSGEMVRTGEIQHVSAISGDPTDRVEASGLLVHRVSENLAIASSAHEAHQGLMRSPAHRANILNSWATEVGIGVAIEGNQGSPNIVVTQLFILRLEALNKIRSPQEAVELINRLRSEKGLRPLNENPWLSEFAQEFGKNCFREPDQNIPFSVSPFEKITRLSFITDYTARAIQTTEDFFRGDVTDIGINIVESRDPAQGVHTVCVTALLGQR